MHRCALKIIRTAGADAELLWPDWYMRAYVDNHNPDSQARVQRLLALYAVGKQVRSS